ncbi:hypothetical protein [Marivirga sp.]|uniref:hypothetical protein n=1 Tax=Marivirga sp. TaxID=2018662 RepID=UPI002D7E2C19|nr:hypothetical protein [Marivirga sp.]HET8859771.1 hypothetical protein [Marivirga sp.]
MKKKTLTLAMTILFMAGLSSINLNAQTAEPTGTYSDDGCGNRSCDGQACDCRTVIVIIQEDCLA